VIKGPLFRVQHSPHAQTAAGAWVLIDGCTGRLTEKYTSTTRQEKNLSQKNIFLVYIQWNY